MRDWRKSKRVAQSKVGNWKMERRKSDTTDLKVRLKRSLKSFKSAN